MPRLRSQLFEIEHLRAAVAFAEGVYIVHVAHDLPGRRCEGRTAQASEEFRAPKSPMNICHAGFDIPAKLKLMTALGDFHGAYLACPIIDVLEHVPVDGAKVDKVEASGRGSLGGSLGHKLPLDIIEPDAIGNAKPVTENGRPRIGIGVVVHSAARGLAFARI